jgi:hypothetical protein
VSHICASLDQFPDDLSEQIWYWTLRFSRHVKDFVQSEPEVDKNDLDEMMTSLLIQAIQEQQDLNERRNSEK